ncbi:DUF5708 family protein [Streptomyces stelliscabiei]|uniref:Uncharacterized protein n=1 Tax=Streptomyces stelliscabiei TaxID=146820 RepID=A0A8I0TU21_9ACTN|nr:DUF5708 family protein [Streptomyces stelliscabiei]KND27187.1 hypothetical protein IQ64_45630 [Streptomyces stelliscabiei]MBE1600304.1 hypothetical protein [Streptomyces stelliscabiei]MDX2520436.1 DUF5708 family protein [Streptomyces stelliscabiei]MDX2557097.1 DUF5708 family protein [Streptomyces stelliscabiei]MDX2616271.1 DUF5708 family protein [Streptomyces stelliscabiei]
MSGTAVGASRNVWEGAGTFVIGLVLWLFTEGVEVPFVTLTKVGVVMMCVGGVLVATGLYQRARGTTGG